MSGIIFKITDLVSKVLEVKPLWDVNDEMIRKPLSTNVRVPASINNPAVFNFWKNILNASDYVLNIVKDGYKFPFKSLPPASFEKNNQSALKRGAFMRSEVNRLEELGVIERVHERPFIVLPLSAVFSGKWRLVVSFLLL